VAGQHRACDGGRRESVLGSLSLAVEPRLSSATRWCVRVDPEEIDGLEFTYLSGADGPQVESRSGWEMDGVEIRVILDFRGGLQRPSRLVHECWCMTWPNSPSSPPGAMP
jgi:hypothetical protein